MMLVMTCNLSWQFTSHLKRKAFNCEHHPVIPVSLITSILILNEYILFPSCQVIIRVAANAFIRNMNKTNKVNIAISI